MRYCNVCSVVQVTFRSTVQHQARNNDWEKVRIHGKCGSPLRILIIFLSSHRGNFQVGNTEQSGSTDQAGFQGNSEQAPFRSNGYFPTPAPSPQLQYYVYFNMPHEYFSAANASDRSDYSVQTGRPHRHSAPSLEVSHCWGCWLLFFFSFLVLGRPCSFTGCYVILFLFFLFLSRHTLLCGLFFECFSHAPFSSPPFHHCNLWFKQSSNDSFNLCPVSQSVLPISQYIISTQCPAEKRVVWHHLLCPGLGE